jgi:hypothetical protein
VKRFVLSRNFAKVRVLMKEPLKTTGSTTRFVAMARRLSSFIEMRLVAPEFFGNTNALLLADDHAVVLRPQANSWEGVAGFQQPSVARLHLNSFDEMWIASAPRE